ncbi:MAG: DUF3604 domain-containing protein [Gammaproteobacteria bacterium]|nr:DUF3604 domain-containing protein [Gammaproteobacteria bacterium]
MGIEEDEVRLGEPEYSPYLNRAYPDRVLWGDTHVHTSYSTDAGMIGNYLGPDEAFRFARGETVRASAGQRARLIRPLDFLVVADHSENLGLAPMIAESNPDLLRIPWGKAIHDLVKSGDGFGAYVMWGTQMVAREDPLEDDDLVRTVWNRIVDSAERFNDPGVFTALHGFEWTSTPEANNLHRVVIFRDDSDEVENLVPFSNYDSSDPEDLWAWLQNYQEQTGGRVLAIAHNGNLSNGLMFDDKTFDGESLSRDYAERRSFWEPLYEVTQIKGDGETHPSLSPNDEFADYWRWDKGNFGTYGKKPDMLPREYARQALMRGLEYEKKLGANPFKFGMIGSTDSHTSLATTREENSFGKATPVEPGKGQGRYMEKITGIFPSLDGSDPTIRHYQSLASGLAAVWSRKNTRKSIWDALKHREVYATTGTRITVRVFGGWDYDEKDVVRPDFAAHGYARGVPMGGDLTNAPKGKAPTLMIRALRDPDGANLDRIQIVKGWLDSKGKPQERIYDVACSKGRTIKQRRCDKPVGNTVDVKNATFTNNIGGALLAGWWEDPDFDPSDRAFYYVRVLEIPTPTWLAYDKAFYGDAIQLPKDALLVHQERAYTSPIWYTPKK